MPALLLLLLACLLSGCAAVSVSTISPADYLAERRGDMLTTGRLSQTAQEVLRVIGIEDCRERPAPCRQTLQTAAGITEEQRLSALSELWLEHALATARAVGTPKLPLPVSSSAPAGDPVLDAWIETARHAYAYLFHTARRPGERAFEDRQTQVRDYYNYAAQQAVSRLFLLYRGDVQAQAAPAPQDPQALTRIGRWQIRGETVEMPALPGAGLPQELVPAASLRFTGLRNTYRRDGFGAEFVAVLEPPAPPPTPEGNGTPPPAHPGAGETQFPSVTALLRFEGRTLAEVMATSQVRVLLYDPYRSSHATLGGEQVPLAANFTAGYGLWLARSGFARQSLRTLFGLSDGIVAPRVQIMQPWNPERRIIVMLHGLASSPEAWVNVANEVMGDEQLRQNYQVWQVYYPTNAPLALNLHSIRQALQHTLRAHDPDGHSVAARNITLVGHSMGGVLARLLVSQADEQLWQLLPPQARGAQAREGMGAFLSFEPLPGVQRAVFIAAPHRGTPFAEERIARRVANLVTLPLAMLQEAGDLARLLAQMRPGADAAGPQAPQRGGSASAEGSTLQRIPNSIDNLSDRDPFVRAAAALPMAPGLPHHSIIGRIDPGIALAQSSDGIVPYASAHLDSAQSERVITSGHSVQEHPAAILELRRILQLPLPQAGRPGSAGTARESRP
ncbi:alpha/beta fold hydrolase [Xenophilus arseniciresistens]|uniref:Alpha/beta fold hydrolase n=1 Tax=Xenophilus arseniciresistens TaxID=1283306 RepID=A0AAE3N5D8_9BURK|nr:alpha/beta fold hydrolase [Xenophilus arseniciresistens]MDA7414913.1 alpha/beta fold hydrolase [Xenophilus arseniciresistens]